MSMCSSPTLSLSVCLCWNKIILWRLRWVNTQIRWQTTKGGESVRWPSENYAIEPPKKLFRVATWRRRIGNRAIFQPLGTPFVWTQALKLIKFVACQWKRHSIKRRSFDSPGDKAKKCHWKRARGAQVPTEINESMNGEHSGENPLVLVVVLVVVLLLVLVHWHSNQVKRENVDFTLTRTWRTWKWRTFYVYWSPRRLQLGLWKWKMDFQEQVASSGWYSDALYILHIVHSAFPFINSTRPTLRMRNGALKTK